MPIKTTMGLTDGRIAACAVVLLLWGNALYAQNTSPPQLGTEIQQLEHRLSAAISPAERHSALTRLAWLRQLSGNIAGAAVNWLDAAAANPDDDAALVSGAYCFAAMGEWEHAASILRPLLAAGKEGPSMLQAQFLDACLRAWSSFDSTALTALAQDTAFSALRPAIYYTLWQTLTHNPRVSTADTAESWKSRLLAEFPQSPEARIARSEKGKNTVSAVQSPLWLLLPHTATAAPSVTLPAATPPIAVPSVTPSAPATPAITSVAPLAPSVTLSAPATSVPAGVLQTGLFGKEANARSQHEALRKAGFTASIFRKEVNGTEYWAVTVPAGQDSAATAAQLKKAGFDSFPVR